jgi:hypothetical protein
MLLTNPQSIDEAKLAAEVEAGRLPRVQFSNPQACDPAVLAHLNACCERFGAKLFVRFFGFYKAEFDAEVLRHLPAVRALIIDLHNAKNVEFLGRLEHLEELGLGVFEGDYPRILEEPGIQRVARLILIDTRRNNIDLAPLNRFPNLTELILNGHARHIEVLGSLEKLRRLALNHIKKSVSFPWIRSMESLRDLTILLGGRSNLDEVSHQRLERLRIDRVRGVERISLAAFPALSRFHMEDQLQVTGLDLTPVQSSLRWMTIWNCKNFQHLRGIEQMTNLEFLWIGKTKVDADALIPSLPSCLREVTLAGYGKKRDEATKAHLQERGFAAAGYIG